MSPGVNFGDTGELIIASKTLGIPHPPGFPTWVIISHLFTYIPVGNIAWRVNLSSAIFTSLTISFVYMTIRYLLDKLFYSKNSSVIMGIFVSLICAFIIPIWRNALYAEVYALVLMFQVLLLYFSLRYYFDKKTKDLYILALIFGLGVGSHYLIFMFVPLVGLIILNGLIDEIRSKKSTYIKKYLISFLFLILGLSVFLFLPMRSMANPLIDWGNPETFSNFKKVVLREQFTNDFFDTNTDLIFEEANESNIIQKTIDILAFTIRNLINVLTIPLVLFGFYGFYLLYKRDRRLFFVIMSGTFISILMFLYAIGMDIESPALSFGYPPIIYVLFILIFSMSYEYFFDILISKLKNQNLKLIFITILILSPLYFAWLNFNKVDYSKNNIAYLHAEKILDIVEDNSVLFVEENNWLFPIAYLNLIEGYKPNVTIFDRNGNLFENIYDNKAINKGIEDVFEIERRKVERDFVLNSNRPAYYLVDKKFENYGYEDVYPYGIIYAYNPQPELEELELEDLEMDISAESSIPGNLGGENSIESGQFEENNNSNRKILIFEDVYNDLLSVDISNYRNFWDSRYILSYYHMQYADYLIKQGEFEKAKKELDKAFEWGREDLHMLNNIGTLLVAIGENQDAIDVFNQALSIKDNKISHYNLGWIYYRGGQSDKAEIEYLRAINLDNNYISAIVSLSTLYAQNGDYTKALYGMRLAEQLNPSDSFIKQKILEYEAMVDSLGDADADGGGNLNESNDFESGNAQNSEINSDDNSYWKDNYQEGYSLAKNGECREAINIFEELYKINPADTQLLNNLGVCYAQTGDLDKAQDMWNQVVAIDPSNEIANDNLKMMQEVR